MIRSVIWLSSLTIAWGSLIVLSHQTAVWTIMWTRQLFGWFICLTYITFWGWAIHISRYPRRTLFRSILCSFALMGILGCLEGAAALNLVHWRLFLQQLAHETSKHSFKRDQELSFRRWPNTHWTGTPLSDIESAWLMPRSLREPLVFTYDQWGYRNSINIEQANVVLIGDSYVEGAYVSDDQTAARYLQALLSRPVVNLGVAGYGPMQELIVLKRDGVRFKPKVAIWFFFAGNDLYDDAGFEAFLKANHSTQGWRSSWKQRSFTLEVLRRLRRSMDPVLPNKAPYFGHLSVPGESKQTIYFANYAAQPWTDWLSERWEKTRQALEQGVQFSRDQNLHLLFVFIPLKFWVYRPFVEFAADSPCRTWDVWPINQLFADFCQSAEVPCLDLTKPLQDAVREGKMPYAIADSHWSPYGHALVARMLFAELHRRGWLETLPRQLSNREQPPIVALFESDL